MSTHSISVDPAIILTQAQWSIIWGHVWALLQVDSTHAGEPPDFSNIAAGSVPDGIDAMLYASGSTAEIEVSPYALQSARDDAMAVDAYRNEVHISLECVDRNLSNLYANQLKSRGFEHLATDHDGYGDNGAGETHDILATGDHSISIYESTPDYSDDDSDGYATIIIRFGESSADRGDDAAVRNLNDNIAGRIGRIIDYPRGQRAPLVQALRQLVETMEKQAA